MRLLKTDKNTSSYSRKGFKQPLPRVTLGIELSKRYHDPCIAILDVCDQLIFGGEQ